MTAPRSASEPTPRERELVSALRGLLSDVENYIAEQGDDAIETDANVRRARRALAAYDGAEKGVGDAEA